MSDDDSTTTGADRRPDADPAAFAERLAAVERAVTDGTAAPTDLGDAAAVEERLGRLEATLDDIDERVSELEAATQALRGYVGGVRAVNRDVERRADLALARTADLTDDAPPDASDALDSRTADADVAAAADAGDGPGTGAGDADDGVGIARRLRDAL